MDDYQNDRPPVAGSGDPVAQPTQQQPTLQAPIPMRDGAAASAGTHNAAGRASADDAMGTARAAATTSVPVPGRGNGGGGDSRGRWWKVSLVGLVGGVLGAAALTAALYAGGVIGNASATTQSSAGRTVTINASSDDATVAQAASAKALPSVVSVNVTTPEGSGLGSGVIYDKDGNIITNYHVVEGATSISVTYNGKSYNATLVGSDSSSDLAVIHVDWDGAEVSPIEVGNSDELVVGDWVMSVGSPFGLDQSVSSGIVSSLARNQMMESASGNTLYTNLIQTDAAINPGNSGGALVDDKGRLVGICTLFSSDTDSFAGIGFAIPGNYAVQVASKIIAGETVTHAYIGLSMQTVNAQNAERNKLSVNQGAYVAAVTEGSPADQAGIEKGDIITAVNGEPITSADGMILNVRSHAIGETVQVTFMRGSEEKTVGVTLGSDEELQKEQAEQRQRQEQLRENGLDGNGGHGNSYGNGGGSGDDGDDRGTSGREEMLRQIYEYLYNDRGGSLDTTGRTTGSGDSTQS